MNKERRARIEKIMDVMLEAQTDLEEVIYEEEEYRDGMPENLQGSERHEKAEEACDYLNEALEMLEEIRGKLEEAQNV